jgi:hypothetical protein
MIHNLYGEDSMLEKIQNTFFTAVLNWSSTEQSITPNRIDELDESNSAQFITPDRAAIAIAFFTTLYLISRAYCSSCKVRTLSSTINHSGEASILGSSSFWRTASSKERQSYRQAFAEYIREVAQQTDQIKAVQEALTRCLEAYEVRNRELRQQHELFIRQHEMEDGSLTEVQGELAPSIEDEQISQQAELIREKLTSYPELPENSLLSAGIVLTTLEGRRNHHAELLALAEQFIPAIFLNLAGPYERLNF